MMRMHGAITLKAVIYAHARMVTQGMEVYVMVRMSALYNNKYLLTCDAH